MEEKEEELVKRCVKNKTRITKRKFLLAKQSYLAERKVHKIALKTELIYDWIISMTYQQ